MSWIRQEPIDSDWKVQQKTTIRVGGPDLGSDFDTSTESGPTFSANMRTNHAHLNNTTSRGRVAGKNPGYVQIRRRSLFTWIVGGFFTLVWIFLLGVMVGRGTITSTEAYKEVEQILAMDRAAEAGPSVEVIGDPATPEETAVNSQTHLTFYDSLTQTDPQPGRGVPVPDMPDVRPEEQAVPQAKPAPKVKVQPKPKPEPTAPVHVAASQPVAPQPAVSQPTPPQANTSQSASHQTRPVARVQRPAGVAFEREELLPSLAAANQMHDSATHEARFSNQENPVDVQTVEEKHSQALPPQRQTGDNFTIQVSAARTIEDADREVKKLKKQGYDAYTYQVELRGRKYFRIRVGRYETREAANEAMDELTQKGLKGMFLSTLTD